MSLQKVKNDDESRAEVAEGKDAKQAPKQA